MMAYCWLVFMISWIGSARLQYINTGGIENAGIEPLNPLTDPLPNFHPPPSLNDIDDFQRQTERNGEPTQHQEGPVLSKTGDPRPEEIGLLTKTSWMPSQVDMDEAMILQNSNNLDNDDPNKLQNLAAPETVDKNTSNDADNVSKSDKRSFSPWKGKRESQDLENSNMWTWKRTTNIREPTMPKRVRFSPWGGKRSTQLIYKPGNKASKIVFANSYPELSRIVSSYSSLGTGKTKLSGILKVPTVELYNPLRILSLGSEFERMPRDSQLFKKYLESSRIFKPGHLYTEVNLKKDGKRKVKFSAWGGKRFPPIIGPIWSPSNHTLEDKTLNAFIFGQKPALIWYHGHRY